MIHTKGKAMRRLGFIVPCVGLACFLGCVQSWSERNAFLAAAETYGAALFASEEEAGAAGAAAEVEFRQRVTVTVANNSTDSDLNVRFAAWVNVSSIRSADQQDALLVDGYVQLTSEARLGSAFTLVPGTFVRNGPGTAGATTLRIAPGAVGTDEATVAATTVETEMITPDVILLFMEPPVSSESVAFTFTSGGYSVDESFGVRATGAGGRKTLGQIDAYQTDPFNPGLFLKTSGGARGANEYLEGDTIRVDFFDTADADGLAAFVTVGESATAAVSP